MRCGRSGVVGLVVGLGLLAGGAAAAGPPVTLVRWAGEGTVLPGRNGNDLVRLNLIAQWDRAALAVNPSGWALRVTLPEGQTEQVAFPAETPPGRSRIEVLVPAASVRDRPPAAVRVAVAVVDTSGDTPASNTLVAGIEQFPRPRGEARIDDPGPFGWGRPLQGPARVLPEPGPDGFRFARVAGSASGPGFFAATAEATVRQVGDRLRDYDPRAGRSDEFSLDAPDQPAPNLTPAKAADYLRALAAADPFRLPYRLPTEAEWLRLARAGRAEGFWWADDATRQAGANWLGPEPALEGDTTAAVDASNRFLPNPAGFFHTFGNLAEWATRPDGSFARMGGHFRTEPADAAGEVVVPDAATVGPDPFVGVRPAFSLDAEAGAALVRKALGPDPALRSVEVRYDPDTATATLAGPVADPAARRRADELVRPFWFVAAVQNQLQTPVTPAGRLARLGPPTAPPRRFGNLGRTGVEVALPVEWSDPLPVAGSAWWVNLYPPGRAAVSHRLIEVQPGRSNRVLVRFEGVTGLDGVGPAPSVALSLGAPAPSPDDPRIVSNLARARP